MITAEDRIGYAPIGNRPILKWPDGARVALWVVPNIEHYEYLPPAHPIRDAYPRTPHPDVLAYGGKDYGNRAGLWRMFEVFDKHRIRGTVSLNLAVIEHYPEVFAACEAREFDYIGHGLYNTRYMWGVSEEEERAHIATCVDLFRRRTGRQLAGWLSPALSHTLLTPDLVAEAGIRYYCDLVHDDQPWPVRVRQGRLITLPYSVDLNDAVAYRQGFEAEDFARMITDTFDTLWREGEESGRVMCIAVHPYNMGQPHRIAHLDAALGYIMSHQGVWAATGSEMADWYYQNMWDKVAPLAGVVETGNAG
ncbi:MAG: polysaccharide deacetylase family protein [Betaproteobacteria bacterium]|nr:polysaccharide deacetylase family protein [Betaproteobacteria bacterium]